MKNPFKKMRKSTFVLSAVLAAFVTFSAILCAQNNILRNKLQLKETRIKVLENVEVELAAQKNTNHFLNHKISRLEDELEVKENEKQRNNTSISDMRDYINEFNNSPSASPTQKPTCAYAGCNNSPSYNSNYCAIHECSAASCHNPTANDITLYCVDHKCLITDCNQRRERDGFFCARHSE